VLTHEPAASSTFISSLSQPLTFIFPFSSIYYLTNSLISSNTIIVSSNLIISSHFLFTSSLVLTDEPAASSFAVDSVAIVGSVDLARPSHFDRSARLAGSDPFCPTAAATPSNLIYVTSSVGSSGHQTITITLRASSGCPITKQLTRSHPFVPTAALTLSFRFPFTSPLVLTGTSRATSALDESAALAGSGWRAVRSLTKLRLPLLVRFARRLR
jgi:hypothetical protein